MKILALDTATEACSAALLRDEEVRLRFEVLGRGHAERLLPMVDELLREAGEALDGLDAIAFGQGPGAFTGVRIAISVAQGLGVGAGIPLVPVSDLLVLGAAALAKAPVADHALACLDARMGEVYWGLAARAADGTVRSLAEGLAGPDAVPGPPVGATCVGAGHGFSAYPKLLRRLGPGLLEVFPALLPDAATLARLAVARVRARATVTPQAAEPVYHRNDVANPAGKRSQQ